MRNALLSAAGDGGARPPLQSKDYSGPNQPSSSYYEQIRNPILFELYGLQIKFHTPNDGQRRGATAAAFTV